MAKPGNFLGTRAMPKVAKLGSAIPGAGTHVRSLEAAGQKVVTAKIATPADSPHLMPTKVPGAKSTRTVKSGTEGF